jgi:hypothetical protein
MKFDNRLKADIDTLAAEMVSKIHYKYFESKDATFIDPACAGGQFLKAIENRLREYGHTDKNIAGRLYGIADNPIDIGWIRKTTGTVANIQTIDPRQLNMIFDVTLTNPPFTLKTQRSDGKLTNKSGVREFLDLTMDISKEVMMIAPCHFAAPIQRESTIWQGTRQKMNKFGVKSIETFDQKEHFPTVSFANPGIIHLKKGSRGRVEQFDNLFGEDVNFEASEYLNTQRGHSVGSYPEHKNGKVRCIVRMKNDGTNDHESVQTNNDIRRVLAPWFVAVQEQSGAIGIKSAIVFDNRNNDTAVASNIHPLYATSKKDAEQLAKWVKSDKFNEMFMQVTRGERVLRGGWLKKLPKYDE